jgi:hypothetical protein
MKANTVALLIPAAAVVVAVAVVAIWEVVAVVASKDALSRDAVPRSVVLRSADPEEVGVKLYYKINNIQIFDIIYHYFYHCITNK